MSKGGENSESERLLDIPRCLAWNVLSRNGWAGIAGYIRNGQIERFGCRLFNLRVTVSSHLCLAQRVKLHILLVALTAVHLLAGQRSSDFIHPSSLSSKYPKTTTRMHSRTNVCAGGKEKQLKYPKTTTRMPSRTNVCAGGKESLISSESGRTNSK